MEDNQVNFLGEKLRESIVDKHLSKKIVAGLKLFGGIIDTVTQLPITNTLDILAESLSNYKSLRLQKKIYQFLFGISVIPQNDRLNFMEELEQQISLKETSGEVLIDLIDRVNSLGKIDVIINLFKAKVRGDIDISDFMRLSSVLDRVSVIDLSSLNKYKLKSNMLRGKYDGSETDSLYSAGLLHVSVMGGNDGTLFALNNLGLQMLQFGLSEH